MRYIIPKGTDDETRAWLERLELAVDEVSMEDAAPEICELYGYEAAAVATEDAPNRALRVTKRVIYHMGMKAKVRVEETEDDVHIDIDGDDLAVLIGSKGATLDALQVLLGTIVNRWAAERKRIHVDVAGYRQRRREHLEDLAHRMADRASRERRSISLGAMPAAERRIVHLALQDVPGITTESEGDPPDRQVRIIPEGARESGRYKDRATS